MTEETYVRLKEILDTVNKGIERLRKMAPKDYMKAIKMLKKDLCDAVVAVNLELLNNKSVVFCDMDYLECRITGYSHKDELIGQYKLWYKTMSDILEEQYHAENSGEEAVID